MKKKAFNQLLFLFIFLLTNYNIANAMKKNTKKTAYQCNMCTQKYYNQNDIYKHIQQHTIDQLTPISLKFVPEKLEPLFNNGRVLKISYNHPINDEHFLEWIENI